MIALGAADNDIHLPTANGPKGKNAKTHEDGSSGGKQLFLF